MARLRHVQSGAVVNVSDDTAARLGSEWQPAEREQATEEKKPRATRRTAKSDDES
jgi:hypothetical protein